MNKKAQNSSTQRVEAPGSAASSAAPCSDALTPDRFPDPWLVDTEYLLLELARIRRLALEVPLTNQSYAPTNTCVDALWRLEEQMRFLLHLHREGQRAFARKTQPKAPKLVVKIQETETRRLA